LALGGRQRKRACIQRRAPLAELALGSRVLAERAGVILRLGQPIYRLTKKNRSWEKWRQFHRQWLDNNRVSC
jgi:hypothetical protein